MDPRPYRAAGSLLERLGPRIRLHRRSNLTVLRTLVYVCILLVIAVPCVLEAFDILRINQETHAPVSVLVTVLSSLLPGLTAPTLAAWLVVRAYRSRDISLDLRKLGFVHRRGGVETTVFWEDVVRFQATGWSGPFGWTLSRKGGERLHLTRELDGFTSIGAVVSEECVRHLLPAALADLDARRSLRFGPFLVTQEGLAFEGRKPAWADVRVAVCIRRMLAIGDAADGVRALPKREGVLCWAKAAFVDVPNAPALMALVDRLGAGTKASGSETSDTDGHRS
jgi:hypothetical protein